MSALSVLAGFLLLVCTLRVYSLVRSCFWIWKNGLTYRNRIEGLPRDLNNDRELLDSILVECGGDFFPCGILTNRIRRRRTYHRRQRHYFRFFLFSILRGAWALYFFVPLVAVMLGVLANIRSATDPWATDLGTGAALVFASVPLAIAAETYLSFVIFRAYGSSYKRIIGPNDTEENRSIGETSAFFGSLIIAWIATSGALYYIAGATGGYSTLRLSGAIIPGFIDQVGLAFYSTLVVLTGLTDPGPTNAPARILVAIMTIEGLAFLLVVFGVLAGVLTGRLLDGEDGDHGDGDVSPSPPKVPGIQCHADRRRARLASAVLGVVVIVAITARLLRGFLGRRDRSANRGGRHPLPEED